MSFINDQIYKKKYLKYKDKYLQYKMKGLVTDLNTILPDESYKDLNDHINFFKLVITNLKINDDGIIYTEPTPDPYLSISQVFKTDLVLTNANILKLQTSIASYNEAINKLNSLTDNQKISFYNNEKISREIAKNECIAGEYKSIPTNQIILEKFKKLITRQIQEREILNVQISTTKNNFIDKYKQLSLLYDHNKHIYYDNDPILYITIHDNIKFTNRYNLALNILIVILNNRLITYTSSTKLSNIETPNHNIQIKYIKDGSTDIEAHYNSLKYITNNDSYEFNSRFKSSINKIDDVISNTIFPDIIMKIFNFLTIDKTKIDFYYITNELIKEKYILIFLLNDLIILYNYYTVNMNVSNSISNIYNFTNILNLFYLREREPEYFIFNSKILELIKSINILISDNVQSSTSAILKHDSLELSLFYLNIIMIIFNKVFILIVNLNNTLASSTKNIITYNNFIVEIEKLNKTNNFAGFLLQHEVLNTFYNTFKKLEINYFLASANYVTNVNNEITILPKIHNIKP